MIRLRTLIVLGALIPAFMVGVAGCAGSGAEPNPCVEFVSMYLTGFEANVEDGTEVEFEGHPAVCEEGEPVNAGLGR